MSYCANALLGVMSTDLTFFENSVPIVLDLYSILVAVGWGLLIGNCAFQCMKAMFAGFGFETESPIILLMRTGLFGFLLIFSKDICEIGLSIGKNVINLLGLPTSVNVTMPNSGMFPGLDASWLLVIIIGFILGFQLIKLFFEIAERYVVVAVLTLLMPVGLSMGGSKSTKDICNGFVRMYATMIVLMVMNVLFLKLILSALATMPSGTMVLPWCLLVVGIAKTARKIDQIISRIGLNPAITGDPLGTGRGFMVAMMAARTIMRASGKGGGAKGGGRPSGSSQTNFTSHYSNNRGGNVRNTTGGTNIGGNNMAAGTTYGATTESNASTQRNSQNSNTGDSRTTANTNSSSNVRFGTNSYGGLNNTKTAENGFNSSGKATVNNNRFGSQTGNHQKPTSKTNINGTAGGNNTTAKTTPTPANSGVNTKTTTKGGRRPSNAGKSRRNSVQQAANNARKTRFGSASASSGNSKASSNGRPKTPVPNIGGARSIPDKANSSVKPDNFETTDTAKEVLQDIGNSTTSPKDGDNNG